MSLYLNPPTWLPPLLPFPGDWPAYESAVYSVFDRDFVRHRPVLLGKPVAVKSGPPDRGREYGFWHLIEEEQAGGRVPDIRRCERIAWPRALVETAPGNAIGWRNTRTSKHGRNHRNLVVALPDFSYVVVLREHPRYFVLWTTYCVEFAHRRAKCEAECRTPGARAF